MSDQFRSVDVAPVDLTKRHPFFNQFAREGLFIGDKTGTANGKCTKLAFKR